MSETFSNRWKLSAIKVFSASLRRDSISITILAEDDTKVANRRRAGNVSVRDARGLSSAQDLASSRVALTAPVGARHAVA